MKDAKPDQAKETQESICTWALSAFGSTASPFRVVTRANEEMAELLRAVASINMDRASKEERDHIAEEAADVAIVLAKLGEMLQDDEMLTREGSAWSSNQVPSNCHLFVARANSNLSSAIYCIANALPPSSAISELRATIKHLDTVCKSVGSSLNLAIDAKMETNRARAWKQDGTGHGYHIRERPGAQQEGPHGPS